MEMHECYHPLHGVDKGYLRIGTAMGICACILCYIEALYEPSGKWLDDSCMCCQSDITLAPENEYRDHSCVSLVSTIFLFM